jgi:tetratricopeptide (TPR) repeat protein
MMKSPAELQQSVQAGKEAFESGRYQVAADHFRGAAEDYAAWGRVEDAAEQNSNLSVTLLQLGRAQEALAAAIGTDEIFAAAGDDRRQGIALNNQAAAYERLARVEEALSAYERSAELLAKAGEKGLRAEALKAAAALQLRRGKLAESGIRMIGVLEAREHPSLFERILRYALRVVQR